MAKKVTQIEQFTADNVPNRIANHVKVVASYVLVVPIEYFETVIAALVNKNQQYQAYTRKNDVIIAILMKGA